jgi:hypothetical protein
MAIDFVCVGCHRKCRARDDQDGQLVPCPGCGRAARVLRGSGTTSSPQTPGPRTWGKWTNRIAGVTVALFGLIVAFEIGRFSVAEQGGLAAVGAPMPAPVVAGMNASKLWPEQQAVLEYITKYANDPSSVEAIEWWPPMESVHLSSIAIDGTSYDTGVYLIYRTRNDLGAMVVMRSIFCLKDLKVMSVEKVAYGYDLARLYVTEPPLAPFSESLKDLVDQPVGKLKHPVRP